MWDFLCCLSALSTSALHYLSQYGNSHLDDDSRDELLETSGWRTQKVEDLLILAVRKKMDLQPRTTDPLLSEHMNAMVEDLHGDLFGLVLDSTGALINKEDPASSKVERSFSLQRRF